MMLKLCIKEKDMYDLLIIGGGASGLLTAALASKKGIRTAVIERNNAPAKKIYATGNGHCNYLNERAKSAEMIKAVLEGVGIVGSKDEEGRYYPLSREASSVARALILAAERNGAKIICDKHITDVVKRGDVFKALSKDGEVFEGKSLVIATGGKAGIQFGCYGEGFRWAQTLGHSLVKPVPALVPAEAADDISDLHGVRVRGEVSLLCCGERLSSERGEIQFTKDSVSGICVMDQSRNIRLGEGKDYELSIDLFPQMEKEELLLLLSSQKDRTGDPLEGLLPSKLKSYIEKDDIKDLSFLSSKLKDLRFRVKGTKGWSDAQVTSGGIPLDEIDMDTMESKKLPGLYFAGEIIDYDGPCGGFNLANAWRSAILIADSIDDGKLD